MSTTSLPILFSRALSNASKAASQQSIAAETQDLIKAALVDLKNLASRISALSLFSPNETLEDISTRDLVYLFAPYVEAEVQNRVKTAGPSERLNQLRFVQTALHAFVANIQTYEIVPSSERALLETPTVSVKDPARRRELKIQQYKKEKDLRSQIETLRKRRSQLPAADSGNEFNIISALLPTPSTSTEDDEPDSETEDVLREASLLLLRLIYVHAHAQLESITQELDLLRSGPFAPRAPEQPSDDTRAERRKQEEDMWRLDRALPRGGPDGQGPLLDEGGKPLRPFTILPSGSGIASDRARFQAQVFRPDHNLPTMSIDEYLEIERQRGNVITGGGPQSEAAPTSSEQLALDAELDGTAFGAEREEERRLKDEKWAHFTDANHKGAGNTMNRG